MDKPSAISIYFDDWHSKIRKIPHSDSDGVPESGGMDADRMIAVFRHKGLPQIDSLPAFIYR